MRREINGIRISVWIESKSITVRDALNKYFGEQNLTSINFYQHGNKLSTARKESNGSKSGIISYNFEKALAIRSNKGAKIMPNDLHSVQWNELQRESV